MKNATNKKRALYAIVFLLLLIVYAGWRMSESHRTAMAAMVRRAGDVRLRLPQPSMSDHNQMPGTRLVHQQGKRVEIVLFNDSKDEILIRKGSELGIRYRSKSGSETTGQTKIIDNDLLLSKDEISNAYVFELEKEPEAKSFFRVFKSNITVESSGKWTEVNK